MSPSISVLQDVPEFTAFYWAAWLPSFYITVLSLNVGFMQRLISYFAAFHVHESAHRESVSVTVQKDATIYSLLYFCRLLYMFRVVIRSIIRSTYNCNYSIWHWSNRLCYLPLSWSRWNSVPPAPRQLYVLLMMGGVATRNMQNSLQKYNKLYIVASCWTIIDTTLLSYRIPFRTLLIAFSRCLFSDKYKTHKYIVGRAYSC